MRANPLMIPHAGMPARRTSTPRYNLLPVGLCAVAVYLLLLPGQFNFSLGDFKLAPFRVFLIPVALYFSAAVARGQVRLVGADFLILAGVAWIWLASFVVREDALAVIEVGGSHTIDIANAYFLTRLTIRTPRDFRVLLVMIAPGIALIGLIVAQEAITHVRFLQPAASALTGNPAPMRSDTRMGFLRGTASFPHPILAGIVLASFLPLYLLAGIRGGPKFLGLTGALCSIFSLSSAAMLGLVVGGFLCIYNWISLRIGNLSWRLFLVGVAILYLFVENTSNRGFYQLLTSYASFSSASGYNRILIWKYGTQNIADNPWFGIGYDDWVRPDWMHSGSFDHFWLILALRFGMPACFLLLGAVLLALINISRRSVSAPHLDAQLLRGVAISMAVFALGVNSVSLWMSALVWFFMLAGITVSLSQMPRVERSHQDGAAAGSRVRVPMTAQRRTPR